MKSVFDVLEERGFISQVSDTTLKEKLAKEKVTMYAGFDPTADSLHLGHLVPVMAMAHFQQAGHRVLALVGGATGMVGDPSGKSEERNLLTLEQVSKNAAAVKTQMERFLTFNGDNAARMVDNYDWIGKMSFLDWLREVGKYFTVNYMLAKDSVKKRIESENGISYTEFSYMTLQAYDFLHLFDAFGCTLQCGGNDQWGNITAGTDLIRKIRSGQGYGMTFPLVTTANGEKFGKTAGNAVWLDPARTSPYQFYQYWIRTDDRDIERYLKFFTFLDVAVIQEILTKHQAAPEKREGQRALAAEVTKTVHGEAGLEKARKASEVLFGGEIIGLSDRDLAEIFADVPNSKLPLATLDGSQTICDLLKTTGLCGSKGEARRLIQGGGIYLNNKRVENPELKITKESLASEGALLLRSGKKNYHLARFE